MPGALQLHTSTLTTSMRVLRLCISTYPANQSFVIGGVRWVQAHSRVVVTIRKKQSITVYLVGEFLGLLKGLGGYKAKPPSMEHYPAALPANVVSHDDNEEEDDEDGTFWL